MKCEDCERVERCECCGKPIKGGYYKHDNFPWSAPYKMQCETRIE